MNRKVLVLGGSNRAALAVVRSLGRKGIEVHLAWYSSDSLVPFSRYTVKTHSLAKYHEHESNWLKMLMELLEREKFDLVIPTEDNLMLPFIKERSRLQEYARLAIPNDKAFWYTYKKNKTAQLCQALGVNTPRQVMVTNADDISDVTSWKFPLVIKPVSSKIAKGSEIIALTVTYVNSKEELVTKLKKILAITPAMVQEYFPGIGVGVELLAYEGKILCAFQHQRVHEPIHGGGSSYRKSVALKPELLSCTRMLISELRWTGVAMVEFKYNETTQEFVLIEINGRFWGSLPLAVSAGMDFPFYLYELLVEDKKEFNGSYKTGIYCRNLRIDIGWFRQNLFTKPSKYNNALPMYKLLPEVFNIITMREHLDTLVLDDLKPGLMEVRQILDRIKDTLQKLFLKCWLRLPISMKLQKKRIKKGLAKHHLNICFVCKGNICRSPFAELYLQKVLNSKGREINIESAGYYPEKLRRCPSNAIRTARRFTVDLSEHRSSVLSEAIMCRSDIVFVFDIENWLFLRRNFRNHKSKVFFIGSFTDKRQIEIIPDPYDKPEDTFYNTYCSIANLSEHIAEAII